MSESHEKKMLAPAYVPYRTFTTFVKSLEGRVLPNRVDRSLLKSYSGSIQTQLIGSLRFLRLISDDGTIEAIFRNYIEADEQARRDLAETIVETAYEFLFQNARFNLANATSAQFQEAFKSTGVTGETVRKAQTFFLQMAKEAGIAISPHLTVHSKTQNGAKRTRNKPNQSSYDPRNEEESDDSPPLFDNAATQPNSSVSAFLVVSFSKGVRMTLGIDGNVLALSQEELMLILDLKQRIETFQQKVDSAAMNHKVDSREVEP